jgi:hypothetical protein
MDHCSKKVYVKTLMGEIDEITCLPNHENDAVLKHVMEKFSYPRECIHVCYDEDTNIWFTFVDNTNICISIYKDYMYGAYSYRNPDEFVPNTLDNNQYDIYHISIDPGNEFYRVVYNHTKKVFANLNECVESYEIARCGLRHYYEYRAVEVGYYDFDRTSEKYHRKKKIWEYDTMKYIPATRWFNSISECINQTENVKPIFNDYINQLDAKFKMLDVLQQIEK